MRGDTLIEWDNGQFKKLHLYYSTIERFADGSLFGGQLQELNGRILYSELDTEAYGMMLYVCVELNEPIRVPGRVYSQTFDGLVRVLGECFSGLPVIKHDILQVPNHDGIERYVLSVGIDEDSIHEAIYSRSGRVCRNAVGHDLMEVFLDSYGHYPYKQDEEYMLKKEMPQFVRLKAAYDYLVFKSNQDADEIEVSMERVTLTDARWLHCVWQITVHNTKEEYSRRVLLPEVDRLCAGSPCVALGGPVNEDYVTFSFHFSEGEMEELWHTNSVAAVHSMLDSRLTDIALRQLDEYVPVPDKS